MRNAIKILMTVMAGLALGACASGPENVEKDFGNSVRQMVTAQTLDPAAAAMPDRDAIDTGDAERLNSVLEAYRADVAKPDDVGQPIVISVGQ